MKSPIPTIADDMRQKRTSAVEQVKLALTRAEEKKSHNAILSVCEDRALERAKLIDGQIANGENPGPLAGVPFVVKDNLVTLGSATTAASHILSDFSSPLQATAVDKLEQSGAICIGKANLDSFGHGGSTENSAYGPTKNAYDPTRVAGGSSGGSAVALALGIVPFALGTDTGGSIRQPASFNGVVGVKPTYGAVSRFGAIAMISSSDCVGTFALTAADAEIVLDIISGPDKRDSVTLADFFTPLKSTPKKQRIGVIKECMNEAVDKEISVNIEAYLSKLKRAGHTVEEVSLPTFPHSLAMYYIIAPAEISSNLSRFDGIRYGKRAEAKTLAELYGKSRDQGFGSENERRILIGSYVLSSGYYDAYYQQAQKARTLLINDFNKVFKNFDLLVSPVAPTTAFKIGEKAKDPLMMYLADVMTVAPSLAGIPAISVPAGVNKDGLPIGVQLIGPAKAEAVLLSLAKSMEAA